MSMLDTKGFFFILHEQSEEISVAHFYMTDNLMNEM